MHNMAKQEPKAKADALRRPRKATDLFTLGGTAVQPGQRLTIQLPIADFYTNTEVTMPVRVMRGRRAGPTLFVSAAVHGDEINGVEIIRRLLRLKLLKRLRGNLIAVPVVNVFGFIGHSRYMPDRRDLNRSFPGSDKGSQAGRLAHLFMTEIVSHCDYGIDLHTGSNHRANLPQIRACLNDPSTERLARAFGAPVVLHADLLDGSLRGAVRDLNIPVLVYEGGEPLRFDEMSIRFGVRGIVSVMRTIGMLPALSRVSKRAEQTHGPMMAKSTTWVRAPHSGLLRIYTPLGASVEKDELMGKISHPLGRHEVEVRASKAGIVIGQVNLPLVNEGDALFHIASYDPRQPEPPALEAFRLPE